jgi:hypothetical protein
MNPLSLVNRFRTLPLLGLSLIALLLCASCSDNPGGSSLDDPTGTGGTGDSRREGSPDGAGTAPATGAPMKYQRPPITDVRQILAASDTQVLWTQPVEFPDAKVQRVLDDRFILIGPDPQQTIAVMLTERNPALKPGQAIYLSGVINPVGEDLSQWQTSDEIRNELRKNSILINAKEVRIK